MAKGRLAETVQGARSVNDRINMRSFADVLRRLFHAGGQRRQMRAARDWAAFKSADLAPFAAAITRSN